MSDDQYHQYSQIAEKANIIVVHIDSFNLYFILTCLEHFPFHEPTFLFSR